MKTAKGGDSKEALGEVITEGRVTHLAPGSTNTGSTSAAPSTAPSGLGIGTIGLVTDPTSGAVTGIQWSIGVAVTTVTFGVGRPVS